MVCPERDFEDEEEKKDDTKKAGSSGDKEPEKIPDCTLDPEIKVRTPIVLWCSIGTLTIFVVIMQPHLLNQVLPFPISISTILTPELRLMDATLSSMNYDANKLPLGSYLISMFLRCLFSFTSRKTRKVDYPERFRCAEVAL